MPGRSLSIGRCCVRNCKSHYLRNSDLVFSSIPKVGINLVNPTRIKITSQRRAAWLRALGLEHLNESSSLINRAVCSLHFQSGIFHLFKVFKLLPQSPFCFGRLLRFIRIGATTMLHSLLFYFADVIQFPVTFIFYQK